AGDLHGIGRCQSHLVFLAAALLRAYRGALSGQMYKNTALNWHDAQLLLQGLGMTLFLFVVSFAAGTLIGFALAIIKNRRVPAASQIAVAYVELFRNSPLLVQLFLVFFGLPSILGINLTPLQAGLIALSINTGAFMPVIVQSPLHEARRGH